MTHDYRRRANIVQINEPIFLSKDDEETNFPARMRGRVRTIQTYHRRFGSSIYRRSILIWNNRQNLVFRNALEFDRAHGGAGGGARTRNLFDPNYKPYEFTLAGFYQQRNVTQPIAEVWLFKSQTKGITQHSSDYYRVLIKEVANGTNQPNLRPFFCSCPEFRRRYIQNSIAFYNATRHTNFAWNRFYQRIPDPANPTLIHQHLMLNLPQQLPQYDGLPRGQNDRHFLLGSDFVLADSTIEPRNPRHTSANQYQKLRNLFQQSQTVETMENQPARCKHTLACGLGLDQLGRLDNDDQRFIIDMQR